MIDRRFIDNPDGFSTTEGVVLQSWFVFTVGSRTWMRAAGVLARLSCLMQHHMSIVAWILPGERGLS